MDIKPGDLVVCVDDHWSAETLQCIPNRPVVGYVYGVRELVPPDEYDIHWGLKLDEVVNRPIKHLFSARIYEDSFLTSRFRPVNDESIDIFRKLVADLPREMAI